MREMKKICEEYAATHSILSNWKKNIYLVFGNYKYNVSLTVNNESVPRSESAIHLGHLLHTKDTHNEMTEEAIKGFNKSFHSFIAKFGTCNTATKIDSFTNAASICMALNYMAFNNSKCKQDVYMVAYVS